MKIAYTIQNKHNTIGLRDKKISFQCNFTSTVEMMEEKKQRDSLFDTLSWEWLRTYCINEQYRLVRV